MNIKASAAYDLAGLTATKRLVELVRASYGVVAPQSLLGEPASLQSDAVRPIKMRRNPHARRLVSAPMG